MPTPDSELFNDQTDLDALLAELLGGAPEVAGPGVNNVMGSRGPVQTINGNKGLKEGLKSSSLYNQYKWKGTRKKQKAKYAAAVAAYNDSYQRAQDERTAQVQQVKTAITKRNLRSRVNDSLNSPQLQDLYNGIEKTLLDNSLAGVTQQYGEILKNQSFQTANQGLTGSSVHAERLGTVQQGQNQAAIQAQGQARQYTDSLKNQNEQKRQALISTVNSENPAQGAQVDSQIQGIVNQTRQLGQQFQNQSTGAQIQQQGFNLQSQALGSGLGTAGGAYQNYQQGYAGTQQANQAQQMQQAMLKYLNGGQ